MLDAAEANIPLFDRSGAEIALDPEAKPESESDQIAYALVSIERIELIGPLGASICKFNEDKFKMAKMPRMRFG